MELAISIALGIWLAVLAPAIIAILGGGTVFAGIGLFAGIKALIKWIGNHTLELWIMAIVVLIVWFSILSFQ